MNFEEELRKKASLLIPTTTRVTNPDGTVYLEDQGKRVISLSSSPGYVVDKDPDLTVGTVRDWLLVSSQDPPTDLTSITNLGVTHILSLLPEFQPPTEVKRVIKAHLCLPVYDDTGFDLTSNELLSSILNFVGPVKSSKDNHRVLIHCNAGISRAPSVAILCLMILESLTFQEALDSVRKARPKAKPNDGFLHQLSQFSSRNIDTV